MVLDASHDIWHIPYDITLAASAPFANVYAPNPSPGVAVNLDQIPADVETLARRPTEPSYYWLAREANRYLIWGGVNAAAIVRREGADAFVKAVEDTAEPFMWDVSKEFFATVLPAAGFEDIGDLMELGMRGMYADQWFMRGGEREEPGEKVIRPSILKNCELAGIYFSVAEWNGLPKTALGLGICRYCETHGLATMMITLPPMVSPSYQRIQSLGMDDKECIFELTTVPADVMERILMVQEKVFGPVE